MVTPAHLNASRTCCRKDINGNPNFYKNNRYTARGAEIIEQKRNHRGVCRTSEYCQNGQYLYATTPCLNDTQCTKNYKLSQNHTFPVKASNIPNSEESQFLSGVVAGRDPARPLLNLESQDSVLLNALGVLNKVLTDRGPDPPLPFTPLIDDILGFLTPTPTVNPGPEVGPSTPITAVHTLGGAPSFGHAISVSHDGERIVVGAPDDDRFYIFDKDYNMLYTANSFPDATPPNGFNGATYTDSRIGTGVAVVDVGGILPPIADDSYIYYIGMPNVLNASSTRVSGIYRFFFASGGSIQPAETDISSSIDFIGSELDASQFLPDRAVVTVNSSGQKGTLIEINGYATTSVILAEGGPYYTKVLSSITVVSATTVTYVVDCINGIILAELPTVGRPDINNKYIVVGSNIYNNHEPYSLVRAIDTTATSSTPVALLPNDRLVIGSTIYDIATGAAIHTLLPETTFGSFDYVPTTGILYAGSPTDSKVYMYNV